MQKFLISVNFASIALGTTLGWTSPVNPKLLDEKLVDTPLNRVPNSEEMSW
jgi:hypothetical protein